mmetsp:Transcript_17707/g.40853  ORF Transcript_17707/g.40853 Transcript_17707/m.40853 type:complete len:139 (-) Transcript_17707:324-740(-)
MGTSIVEGGPGGRMSSGTSSSASPVSRWSCFSTRSSSAPFSGDIFARFQEDDGDENESDGDDCDGFDGAVGAAGGLLDKKALNMSIASEFNSIQFDSIHAKLLFGRIVCCATDGIVMGPMKSSGKRSIGPPATSETGP